MKIHNNFLKIAVLTALSTTYPLSAVSVEGDYIYELFTYPGAAITQAWSTNKKGEVAANYESGSFIYDSKSGGITDIETPAGFSSVSILVTTESGVLIGSGIDVSTGNTVGLIIDKQGQTKSFEHPGTDGLTQPRGMSSNKVIAGYYRDSSLTYLGSSALQGFTYNIETEEFSSFVPSLVTIAQGINSDGYVVGHGLFVPDENPCNSEATELESFSFVRNPEGELTYFNVNDAAARARGISNNGTIVGYIIDSDGIQGFKIQLPIQNCTTISIPEEQLLTIPGTSATFPQYISESGNVISGLYFGEFGNDGGFIATK